MSLAPLCGCLWFLHIIYYIATNSSVITIFDLMQTTI